MNGNITDQSTATPRTQGDDDAAARRAIADEMWAELRAGKLRLVEDHAAKHPAHEEAVYTEHQRRMETLASPFGVGAASTGPAADEADPTGPLEQVGRLVGRWTLQRELGKGGQGAVWLALDEQLGPRAAVNMLNATAVSDDVLARFRREANLMAELDHPALCGVHAAGFPGRTPCIAMRYVEGETLAARIKAALKGRLGDVGGARPKGGDDDTLKIRRPEPDDGARPLVPNSARSETARSSATTAARRPSTAPAIAGVLALIEEVARALHVLHQAGVVHRDVKPGNIMVAPTGAPVLLDLGLAQDRRDGAKTRTQTGVVMGTPEYMSPDQWDGAELNARSDVWSLGVTLYECLTLRRPFTAATDRALEYAIQHAGARDPRRLNRAVRDDLRIVLETALEKDPARRYATASDFAEDLRRVRLREQIRARPVSRLTKLVRWTERSPYLAAASALLFLSLAGGLSASLFFQGQKDEALKELTAALTDYDRLSDVSVLARLVAEAETLWPATPERKDVLEDWLTAARRLKERLPGHQAVLAALTTSSEVLPRTPAERAADRARMEQEIATRRTHLHKERAEIVERQAAVALANVRAASRPQSVPVGAGPSVAVVAESSTLLARLAALDAEHAGLERRLDERLTWRFASSQTQFKYETFQKLVADLEAFVDSNPAKGALASVQQRLSTATSVKEATLGAKYAAAWTSARKSIADPAGKHRGLEIVPQLGLIPLGKNPQSELWEFVHWETTAPELRDAPLPDRLPDGRLDLKDGHGLVFVLIPGGTFQMGARRPTPAKANNPDDGEPLPPNDDPAALDDESTVHTVTLAPFFLSKYEMTQGQWLRLVGTNPSGYLPGRHHGDKTTTLLAPVEQVSWDDCAGERGWIDRLGLDLPTEAQWECACRAGTTTPWWTGWRKESLVEGANLADASWKPNPGQPNMEYEAWSDGFTVHAPVGTFAPNGFGLHDTLGNVGEWCRDGFTSYANDNWRNGDGLRDAGPYPRVRVARGGSFRFGASLARASYRFRETPGRRSHNLGVRPSKRVAAP